MLNREGYCRNCNYPLKGLPSGSCPECGTTFSWFEPKTYRNAQGEPVDVETGVRMEHKASTIKRGIVLGALLLFGLGTVLLTRISPGYFTCLLIILYPIWQTVTIVAALSLLAQYAPPSLAIALLIGIGIGLVLGVPVGMMGIIAGVPAGLLGAILFKQFELNSML